MKSNTDYINFVEKYISLVEDEFNFIENKIKKWENILPRIPLLISIVNTIDALRWQTGMFVNFRNKLKWENNFQSKLYWFEWIYNSRLEKILLNLYEDKNIDFKNNKSFQQMYDIYLNRWLKEFSINDTKKIKILFIADRAPYEPIENILEKNKNIELIITLWDLEYSDIKYLENVKNIPKIWIYWNHCDWEYLEKLWIINLHLKTFEFKWIKFWWFEWSIKYKKSDYLKMYTQDEVNNLMKDFEPVNVLITHNSPFWIHDEDDSAHIWFKAINKYIEEKRPNYLFHWHTHLQEKITVKNNTRINFIYWSEVREIKFI